MTLPSRGARPQRMKRYRELKNHAINKDTSLRLRQGSLPSITFAREARVGNKGRRHMADVGFERIEGAEEVMRLMAELQEGKHA